MIRSVHTNYYLNQLTPVVIADAPVVSEVKQPEKCTCISDEHMYPAAAQL